MEANVILFVALVISSAFFSGAEIAFFSLTPGKLRSMVRQQLRFTPILEKLKRNPQRVLVTVLVGNNIVNISAAAIATKVAIDTFGSAGVGIASGAVTLVVLVFGEIIPKSFAQVHASTMSRWCAPILRALEYILWPLVVVFEHLIHAMHAIAPGGTHKKELVSEDEIRSMMHVALEEGSVEHHEHEFVERLFRFNDMPVSKVMTYLEDVVMIDGDQPVTQISHFAAHSGYSRFPVYTGSRQHVVGIVHLKDLLRVGNSAERERPVSQFVAPLQTVGGALHIDDLFREMQKKRQHALMVEQAGENIGFVTMEDIIEELLGEIHDESDHRKSRFT